MSDERPTSGPQHPPRSYRDTEPLAIWGLVLTFVFWPLGLVLSYLALRRIRRTGDGGWGIAMVGAVLSTIATVVGVGGLLWFLATSGIVDQWQDEAQTRGDRTRVHAVVTDIARGLDEHHAGTGEWLSSFKDLDDVDVDAEGAVRGVEVLAFRSGDAVCVQGSRPGYSASYADGEVQAAQCPDRGYALTLSAATADERQASAQADLDATVAEVRVRGEEKARTSSLGPPADLGVRHVPEVDVEVCSLLAGNRDHLADRSDREALVLLLEEPVGALGDLDLENALYTMAGDLDLEQDSIYAFWQGYLGAEFTCWYGGFVDVEGPPDFPEAWQTPLTAEDRAEQTRVHEEWDQMSDEDRAAISAEQEAAYDREQAQIESIIAAGYGSGT
ncbi:DUF4190 domain-containing protein [Cellulomonas sp. KRMCY2]|uniref:DUF4190 domain-containing protein n=1 Tax=Cellulomonas sp. KRMCY2 TaxID=1304865 RepID=UPI00045E9539|nr:DUF4190 domain-containing protein [Cellulomonas sp. KRMCY2]